MRICSSNKYFQDIKDFLKTAKNKDRILLPNMDFSGENSESARKELAI